MTSDSLDVVPWTPPPETIRCVPTKDVNLRLFVPLCLALLGGCSRGASPAGAKADDGAPQPTPPVATVASSAPAAASSPEESSEVPPRHPAHDVPVCGRTERVFFECHVRDHGTARVARVCGSKDGPVAARYLAFLYGTAARTETEIVVLVALLGETARYARYTRPLVTGLAAGFANGAKRFELEQWYVEDIRPAERSAGLVLYEGDEGMWLPCVPLPKESLTTLEDLFPVREEPWTGGSLW
jgi:hypothetical protein